MVEARLVSTSPCSPIVPIPLRRRAFIMVPAKRIYRDLLFTRVSFLLGYLRPLPSRVHRLSFNGSRARDRGCTPCDYVRCKLLIVHGGTLISKTNNGPLHPEPFWALRAIFFSLSLSLFTFSSSPTIHCIRVHQSCSCCCFLLSMIFIDLVFLLSFFFEIDWPCGSGVQFEQLDGVIKGKEGSFCSIWRYVSNGVQQDFI